MEAVEEDREGQVVDCASSPGPSLGPHRGTGQCWPMGRQGGHMAPFCSRSLLTEVPSLEGLTLFLIFLRIFFRAFSSDFVRGSLVGMG